MIQHFHTFLSAHHEKCPLYPHHQFIPDVEISKNKVKLLKQLPMNSTMVVLKDKSSFFEEKMVIWSADVRTQREERKFSWPCLIFYKQSFLVTPLACLLSASCSWSACLLSLFGYFPTTQFFFPSWNPNIYILTSIYHHILAVWIQNCKSYRSDYYICVVKKI